MALEVLQGHASLRGPREVNEDFCGLIAPAGAELEAKGLLAAIADGVSGHGGGRQAAEFTVRGLLSDYYGTPATWAVPFALDRVLNATNRWLMAQGSANQGAASLATTLSALVLRGRRYVIAHIGDSRVYLLRKGGMTQLTRDHVWEHPDLNHVLTRAIGLDTHLALDFVDGQLEPGDVFLLATDGVWAPLGRSKIADLLKAHEEPQQAASALCGAALAAGGTDNASAVVLRVEGVPNSTLADTLAGARALPLPPLLHPGDWLDAFEVLETLHDSRQTLLYRVRRRDNGQIYALKTLRRGSEDQVGTFLAEEWMAQRLQSEYFAEVLPLAAGERSALYYVMSFHPGHSLAQLLESGRHFAVGETMALGAKLLKALSVLHRLHILHRDVKPHNVLLGGDGVLRLLDLGVALDAGGAQVADAGTPGTPSYIAPELFAGAPPAPATDLYAAGVTLYQLLTRKFPYGEIEPFQHPRFGDPAVPSSIRRDLPPWVDALLLKAVARDPARRFETAEEFLLALERGPQNALAAPRRTPLVEREPLKLWICIALGSLAGNLILVWLLLAQAAR